MFGGGPKSKKLEEDTHYAKARILLAGLGLAVSQTHLYLTHECTQIIQQSVTLWWRCTYPGLQPRVAQQHEAYLKRSTLATTPHLAQQYEKNLRKGQLADNTIMLWNDRCSWGF